MIVLETLEQFIKHSIVPPLSRKAIRKDYLNQIQLIETNELKEISEKLENVKQMWKKRVDWHTKDFGPSMLEYLFTILLFILVIKLFL